MFKNNFLIIVIILIFQYCQVSAMSYVMSTKEGEKSYAYEIGKKNNLMVYVDKKTYNL
jgi:hypothetical protein